MTGAQALDMLMARLGNRTNTTLRARILLEMNQIQHQQLEQGAFRPWFLLSTDTSKTLTVGQRTVTLPTDWLSECEEDEGNPVEILDSSNIYRRMVKKTFGEAQSYYGDDATSDLPEVYSLQTGALAVFPLPTVASQLRLTYYGSEADVADDTTTNAWLTNASDWLIAETGIIAASQLVQLDATKVSEFVNLRDKAFKRVHDFHVARQEANQDRNMG